MLGSSADGEVLNAVYAMRNILMEQNKNISDLTNFLFVEKESNFDNFYKNERPKYDSKPQNNTNSRYNNVRTKEHKRMAEVLTDMDTVMTNWESTFIKSIMDQGLGIMKSLSDKQAACLEKIHAEYKRRGNI